MKSDRGQVTVLNNASQQNQPALYLPINRYGLKTKSKRVVHIQASCTFAVFQNGKGREGSGA